MPPCGGSSKRPARGGPNASLIKRALGSNGAAPNTSLDCVPRRLTSAAALARAHASRIEPPPHPASNAVGAVRLVQGYPRFGSQAAASARREAAKRLRCADVALHDWFPPHVSSRAT